TVEEHVAQPRARRGREGGLDDRFVVDVAQLERAVALAHDRSLQRTLCNAPSGTQPAVPLATRTLVHGARCSSTVTSVPRGSGCTSAAGAPALSAARITTESVTTPSSRWRSSVIADTTIAAHTIAGRIASIAMPRRRLPRHGTTSSTTIANASPPTSSWRKRGQSRKNNRASAAPAVAVGRSESGARL